MGGEVAGGSNFQFPNFPFPSFCRLGSHHGFLWIWGPSFPPLFSPLSFILICLTEWARLAWEVWRPLATLWWSTTRQAAVKRRKGTVDSAGSVCCVSIVAATTTTLRAVQSLRALMPTVGPGSINHACSVPLGGVGAQVPRSGRSLHGSCTGWPEYPTTCRWCCVKLAASSSFRGCFGQRLSKDATAVDCSGMVWKVAVKG